MASPGLVLDPVGHLTWGHSRLGVKGHEPFGSCPLVYAKGSGRAQAKYLRQRNGSSAHVLYGR